MLFQYLSENIQKPVFPNGNTLNVRSLPSTQSEPPLFVKMRGEPAGFYTGYAQKDSSSKTWLLLLYPINGKITSANKAWVREDVVMFAPSTPTSVIADTEMILKNIVDRDKKLYQQLLTIAEIIERAKSKKINVDNQEIVFNALLQRYIKRQKYLKDLPGATTQIVNQSGLGPFYWLYQKFSSSVNGIGAVWFIPLAISAVVGVAITVALYYAIKPEYDTQTRDLEISGKFKDLLNTLPEKDKQEIVKNLEGQIDDAYNAGKTDEFFSNIFSVGKWVLIIGVIAYGTSNVLNAVDKQKKQADATV